ncbi:hypothetical protein AAY473_007379 [Plecturocebus cupreus]
MSNPWRVEPGRKGLFNLIFPIESHAVSPRPKCSGEILAHCNLCFLLPASRVQAILLTQPPEVMLCHPGCSAVEQSQLTTTSASQRYSCTLLLRLECKSTVITHCNLELLDSSNPPTSASQVAS